MLRDSSMAAHNNGVEPDDDGSMENGPAESGESAVKPDTRSPGWIKRYMEQSLNFYPSQSVLPAVLFQVVSMFVD